MELLLDRFPLQIHEYTPIVVVRFSRVLSRCYIFWIRNTGEEVSFEITKLVFRENVIGQTNKLINILSTSFLVITKRKLPCCWSKGIAGVTSTDIDCPINSDLAAVFQGLLSVIVKFADSWIFLAAYSLKVFTAFVILKV